MKHFICAFAICAAVAGTHAALAAPQSNSSPADAGIDQEADMFKADTIALSVRTAGGTEYFRRSGIRFSRDQTVLALESWPRDREGAERLRAICAEPRLVVEELSEMPDERVGLHMSPEELATEVVKLRGENEIMAEELAALRAGATPQADYESMNKPALKQIAQERGVRLPSDRVSDIREALQRADVEGPELELMELRDKLQLAELELAEARDQLAASAPSDPDAGPAVS